MNNRLGQLGLLFFLEFFCVQSALGQSEIIVFSSTTLPAGSSLLLQPDAALRGQVKETEVILDLVGAWMTDSIVEVRRQRLLGFGGWVAQRFGSRYWEIMDTTKRKYVGTMSRRMKIYDGISAEYDINVFLMPHLSKYIAMAKSGFEKGLEHPRSKKAFRFDSPDYECPEELKFEDRGYITIECEGTPAAAYREELEEVFLPMSEGKHALDHHPNFGLRYPAMGLYGTWCLDCNHNCRPEIHPMEWMWWLDLSEDRPGSANAKSWMIGVLRDGSGRMDAWSPGPLSGVLTVPIALPAMAGKCTVELEHLVFDGFQPEKVAALQLPETAVAAEPGAKKFIMDRPQGGQVEVSLKFSGKNPGKGMQVWWSAFEQDKVTGTTLGYLNIATSVDNVYAGRLTVDWEE